jgi:RNA polymerase sigma-70 factor (ECF subfamily)
MTEDSNGPSLDERVRALLEGKDPEKDKKACTAIIKALEDEVFGFLIRTLGDRNDADDVFDLVKEKIWRSIGKFRWQCSLRTWTYKIVRNESIRFMTGARRHDRNRASFSELDDLAGVIRSQTYWTRFTEKLDRVKAILDEFPYEDRILMVLRIDRGLKWKQIARIFLGDSEEPSPDDLKRESDRLRQRYATLRKKILEKVRDGDAPDDDPSDDDPPGDDPL